MAIFTVTSEETRMLESFIGKTESLALNLKEMNDADAKDIELLIKNFRIKVNDFFREERRLNIGIVGQVKAGKSSFLNTLLFDGKSVLPKASTPKTATLTKIEYAEENAMEVEYYTTEDWEEILETASVDSVGSEYESARELREMAAKSGIDVKDLQKEGRRRIPFACPEDLMKEINDYVGENGRYTAFVKAVVLYINNPLLSELSIVDTPGLNDPVLSRTRLTKKFIEVCDVVYFLSPCSYFLEKSDWTLLSTKLPQKGVKKLILVGSKFDSGIRDVLREPRQGNQKKAPMNTADNIPAAIQLARSKLTTRARNIIADYQQARQAQMESNIQKTIDGCREPVFVSAIAENMRNRSSDSYDAEECNVYNALAKFTNNLPEELPSISGFDEVKRLQDEVVREKEDILKDKCSGFIPTAQAELTELLLTFLDKAQRRKELLEGSDREQLIRLKSNVGERIDSIRSDIQSVTNDWLARVEREKAVGIRDLRSAAKEDFTIETRTGTETKTGSRRISTSKWYKPWTWGSYYTDYYTYESSYTYVMASDATDSIGRFISDSQDCIEEAISAAINPMEMKRKLLEIVAARFDMGDERCNASAFRMNIDQAISRIDLPAIKIDCSSAVDSIASRFSGQLRSKEDQSALENALSKARASALDALVAGFEKSASEFKSMLSNALTNLQETLLQDMSNEFEDLIRKLDDKDEGIRQQNNYIDILNKELKEAPR